MRSHHLTFVSTVFLSGVIATLWLALFGWSDPACRAVCNPESCQNPPCCNGDVNGDGQIDLSDAVYTLTWLFLGGNAPVAIESQDQECQNRLADCEEELAATQAALTESQTELAACQAELGQCSDDLAACNDGVCTRSPLPATGQSLCYDDAGNVVPCDGTGQDGDYKKGCLPDGRFPDNGDGTVTDHCTGLMWQKETAPGTYNFDGAIQYCEGLVLADQDDWRLPNVRELQSIADYGRIDPSIDSVFGAVVNAYRSSTTYTRDPRNAWVVSFGGGGVLSSFTKGEYGAVRAVRDAR